MRLLNVHDFTLHSFAATEVPRYVVASHRWSVGFEASITDITKRRRTQTSGYRKVEGFARYIKGNVKGIDWLWIDTCCLDRDSTQEVSEAINSMFRWYRNAALCVVLLADVPVAQAMYEFRRSSWFRRGWTLQELIAPLNVIFLAQNWQTIGHKGGYSGLFPSAGPSLETRLAEITRIPERVLRNDWRNSIVDVDEIFRWTVDRETTEEEDLSYCLFGLFNVSLPVMYGEGRSKARERLLVGISEENAVSVPHLTGAPSTYEVFGALHRFRQSAADLLSLMSFYDGQNIPEFLSRYDHITKHPPRPASKSTLKQAIRRVIRRDALTSGRRSVSLNGSLEEDIITLRDRHLVSIPSDGSVIEMQRSVQLAVQGWLQSQGQYQQWAEQSIQRLDSAFPDARYKNWNRCRALYPHAKAIASLEGQVASLQWASILHKAAWFAWRQGLLTEAEAFILPSIAVARRTVGEDSEAVLTRESVLTSILRYQGKYKTAEPIIRRVLRQREIVLGEEHPETLSCVGKLASLLQDSGELKAAEAMYRRELEGCTRVFGENDIHTLSSLANLAALLHHRGNVEAAEGMFRVAEEMHRRALEGFENAVGVEGPDTLSSVYSLALLLEDQGKLGEAEAMHRRALEGRTKVLGKDHPSTLGSLWRLGSIYCRRKEYGPGIALCEQACNGLTRVLGASHPDTVRCVEELSSRRLAAGTG